MTQWARRGDMLERVFFALVVRGGRTRTRDLQEQAVRESGLDYTIVRPTCLDTWAQAPAATPHASAVVRSLRRLREPTSPDSSWMRSAPASTLARRSPREASRKGPLTARTCLSACSRSRREPHAIRLDTAGRRPSARARGSAEAHQIRAGRLDYRVALERGTVGQGGHVMPAGDPAPESRSRGAGTTASPPQGSAPIRLSGAILA